LSLTARVKELIPKMDGIGHKLKGWSKRLKREVWALYFAYKHPDLPWYTKILTLVVVGYALSPVDLIPDFIPVIGYVDDLILLPLGIWLVMRLIPPPIMVQCRIQAEAAALEKQPRMRAAGIIIVLLWLAAAVWIAVRVLGWQRGRI
jgi:uncharacterized membrane protein YkvA (DUF1232 family)